MNIINENSFGKFRNYTDSQFQDRVERTYKDMQINQTLTYVKTKKAQYFELSHGKQNIYELFNRLEIIHDESDPDNDLPQIEHAYQTAEAVFNKLLQNESKLKEDLLIRSLFREHEWNSVPDNWKSYYLDKKTINKLYKEIIDWSWFPLVGFIHDLGKIMALKEYGGLPQWSVVGDTYPVGCPFAEANVFYNKEYYKQCIDYNQFNTLTDTTFGIYAKGCGFDIVEMSFGHDEYIYKIAKQSSKIPAVGLYVLRYHSFYPWHTPQNGGIAYQELASKKDWNLLPLLKAFQKADLYSKLPELPPKNVLEKKYHTLLKKYIPSESLKL